MAFDRTLLEEPRSLDSMNRIVDQVFNDRESYPDKDIYLRIGTIKDLVEEYIPLLKLSLTLKSFKSAKLTPPSFSGPDALITLADGSEVGVQITTVGERYSTALNRERLARAEIVFPKQTAERNKPENSINVTGRAFSTRAGNIRQLIRDVAAAIDKKCQTYRNGSQFLLISSGNSIITLTQDWQQQLASAFKNMRPVPYDSIYVSVDDECVKIWPATLEGVDKSMP